MLRRENLRELTNLQSDTRGVSCNRHRMLAMEMEADRTRMSPSYRTKLTWRWKWNEEDGALLTGEYEIRHTWLGHFDYLLIGENERGDLEEILPLQGLMEEFDPEEVIKQLDVDRIV